MGRDNVWPPISNSLIFIAKGANKNQTTTKQKRPILKLNKSGRKRHYVEKQDYDLNSKYNFERSNKSRI